MDWRSFGANLSDQLINDVFATARRDVVVTKKGNFDPILETSTDEVFNGKCIRLKFDGSKYQSQNILDAEFKLIIKASEVPFEIRQDDCEIKVQDLSPADNSDLGMIDCTILSVSKDPVGAVYTIFAKRS